MKNDNKNPPISPPKLRFLLSHPSHMISLGLGSGLSPVMPGTMGTLLAWFIYYGLSTILPSIFTPAVWGIIILSGFFIGIPVCRHTGNALNSPDYSGMVWDEIIAFWLVLLFIMPTSIFGQLLAFILFRFFDIVKPPPIRYIDRHLKGGFGVMLDDIFAAFFTLIVLAIVRVQFSF